MEGNKGYVARVISNYQFMLDEKLIQEGYMNALYYGDSKMFNKFHEESKVAPAVNIVGLMKQLSKQKNGERFLGLLKKFE